MKRIICALMCFVLLMATTSVASASNQSGVYEYEINNVEYTVEFEDKTISPEKMEMIAETLLGLRDNSTQTYGLGCTLFGHDWVTKGVFVTEHKKRTTAPRCLRHTYNVTYCEDCDETKETVLISSGYVDCCPEE
jgi:hypothetical protein